MDDGDILSIEVEGRLDYNSAEAMQNKILAGLDGVKHLILDFKKLEYLASAGLRTLLVIQKTMAAKGGDMKILHVDDAIMEIFEITGFTDVFQIGNE